MPVLGLVSLSADRDEAVAAGLGGEVEEVEPSWELTYPTYGRGKSSSQQPFKGICDLFLEGNANSF